jgi:hypothetical protein
MYSSDYDRERLAETRFRQRILPNGKTEVTIVLERPPTTDLDLQGVEAAVHIQIFVNAMTCALLGALGHKTLARTIMGIHASYVTMLRAP